MQAAKAFNFAPLVKGLRKTFLSGRTRPLEWRKAQLNGITKLLDENAPRIYEALKGDMGKPEPECLLSEIVVLKNEIREALANIASWTAPQYVRTPLLQMKGLSSSYTVAEPLGAVLIIGAWNYPILLTLQPLVGALTAGNAAVIKPSEVAERTSHLLAELLPRYVDSEAVKVIEGAVDETTALLRERWDHIFYTGNGVVGRIVARAAAEHLTPVTLELGGKSPVIVDKDCHIPTTANRLISGKIFNAGQSCIAPDYVLVHESVAEQLIAAMKLALKSFLGENPKESADFGRIINNRHWKRIVAMIDGEVLCGGDRDEATRYIAPTLIRTTLDSKHKAMQEEIFGPILPIITIPNLEVAVEYINRNPKPLALYIFSTNSKVVQDVIQRTSSGGVCVNETMHHFLNLDLPFGGVGESGCGNYHGRNTFDNFSHKKAVLDKTLWGDMALRYPPWTQKKMGLLKHML